MSRFGWDASARITHALPVAGLAVAAPILTWWAVGDLSTTNRIAAFYSWGPYHFNPRLEFALGCLLAVVAVAALAALALRGVHKNLDGRTWALLACLCGAGGLAAAGWRVETAGVDGANIGGDLIALVGPCLIAGLLVGAAVISSAGRGTRSRLGSTVLVVAAALTAPGLYGVMQALSYYDGSIGVISHDDYNGARIGETRSALHHALGTPYRDTYQFFAPVRAGLSCDYYVESTAGTSPDSLVFRFCFRADVLVSKDLSDKTYVK